MWKGFGFIPVEMSYIYFDNALYGQQCIHTLNDQDLRGQTVQFS